MATETILYLATTNAGKLRDFAEAAENRGLRILPLPGLRTLAEPAEDEPTFEGNARAKAIYYSGHLPGEIVLADDSGLEVDALHSAPGVRSARYAADGGFAPDEAIFGALSQDERNNLYLLKQLAGVETRNARYRCALAAARDGHVLLVAEGSVDGQILAEPRGSGGFGYDPLFYLPELERTMAEIDLGTKNGLSHRGRALRALLAGLEGLS